MVEKKDVSQRIREAMEAKGLNQVSLARESGINQSNISRYLRNAQGVRGPEVAKLARALGVSTDYLLTGHDPPARLTPAELPQPVLRVIGPGDVAPEATLRTEEFVAVPLLEDSVAAGGGRFMTDQVEGHAFVYGPLIGRRRDLVAVRVSGDSMSPVLRAGSVVVVDRGDRLRITPRGIYMVKVDGGCGVKYLEQDGAELVLIPENREYREQRIPLEPGQESPVVGRVVWSWSSWAPPDPEDDGAGGVAEKRRKYKSGR